MKFEAIDEFVGRDESQTFERKRSLAQLQKGLESLCGMINSELAKGVVLFGVAPDGEVVGVEPGNLDRSQRSISQAIDSNFEPRLQFNVEVGKIQGKKLLAVAASRNRDVPYHEYNGRAFIREGTVTRQMTLTEKRSLERMRNRDLHPGPWRCDRCGSWVGVLISAKMTNQGMRKTYNCECGGEFWPVF